jgi:outer membrane receptor protein involved in Fe transport
LPAKVILFFDISSKDRGNFVESHLARVIIYPTFASEIKNKTQKIMKTMNQIRVFLVTVMLTVSAVVMAQKTTITGVLMDKTLNEGEPFATVRVFKQGKSDKPVAMFLTDENGHFSQEVKGKGKFDIVFSSVGKNELRQTLELGNENPVDLGTLYIEENATMLKGVEIVAQKPLVKMEVDKMSYNVAEDEDSKSNTVLDMLRKVPMVTVDGQDNITVNGSTSFKVYVDGMPNVMFSSNPSMVFKSMPATAVKSIEVVTNPGAKYDAEGAAGILNIVMNKQNPQAAQSMNGYNGTVRASAGNKQLGASVFVNGQQGKLSYSANVMTSYNKPGNTTTEMEQIQDNGNSQILTSDNDVKTPFTMGSLSLGYQLDSMSVINATAQFNSMSMKSTGTTNTTLGGYGNAFSYGSTTDMKNSRTSFNGSIDYQRFFNKEHTQSLALTYQLNYSPATTKMTNNFNLNPDLNGGIDLTNRYSENKDKTTNHIFQLDYTMPLATGHTLSLGSKLQLHDATSDSKYYLLDVYDTNSSSEYEYKNSILAGYGEYAGNWNKFGLKAGLRYEYTWQDVEYHLGNGQDFKTNYGNLVPTASMQYTLSQGSNLGLTYNMRISRPGISYLNPYVDRTNPIALSYGNPNLEVEKSHNISLVYNMFTSKLMVNLNLHHNFTDNAISQYSFYDDKNILNTTYGNVVKRHQTGINGYVNYLLTKDTRIFFNGGLNYTDLRSTALDQKNSGWTANIMAGLQQTLPWDLKLSAFAITSTKSYTLQGWSGGFNILTATLSKSLLNDKLTLGIQGIVGLNKGGTLNIETESRGKDFTSHNNIKVPIYGATFTVSYTFGNTKMRTQQRTTRVENDFIEQQSQGEMLNSVGNIEQ